MNLVEIKILYEVSIEAVKGYEEYIKNRIRRAIDDEIVNHLESVTAYRIDAEMKKES